MCIRDSCPSLQHHCCVLLCFCPSLQRADIGLGGMTITYDREQYVDFTKPYLTLGITILYRKPIPKPPDLFSFLSPLSVEVSWEIGLWNGVYYSLPRCLLVSVEAIYLLSCVDLCFASLRWAKASNRFVEWCVCMVCLDVSLFLLRPLIKQLVYRMIFVLPLSVEVSRETGLWNGIYYSLPRCHLVSVEATY